VKREIAAAGFKLHDVTAAQIQWLAEAYVEGHRNELIRVACDMVRTGAGLQELAEKEARRRAKAKPLVEPKTEVAKFESGPQFFQHSKSPTGIATSLENALMQSKC
jgi:hypothetical protein